VSALGGIAPVRRGAGTAWWAIAACMAVLVVIEAVWIVTRVMPGTAWHLGMDATFYAVLGRDFVATGAFYQPHQLTGPYQVALLGQGGGDTLYPPSALLLFVPFAYLPAALWWVIPIGVTVYAIARLRPSPLAVAVMLALLLWPRAIGAFLFGNTDMWMAAALAAGLVWGWPSLALTIKPTLLPLALIGIRRRSWWIGAALGLVFIAVTLPLWMDYVTAMRYATGIDLSYNLGSLPLLAIPLVAYFGSAAPRVRTYGASDTVTASEPERA
jgi:hypothetical protein